MIFLLLLSVFGAIGFAALGYVHVYLAGGKKFKDQDKKVKKVILCVSFAQFPCLFMVFYGGFELVTKWKLLG